MYAASFPSASPLPCTYLSQQAEESPFRVGGECCLPGCPEQEEEADSTQEYTAESSPESADRRTLPGCLPRSTTPSTDCKDRETAAGMGSLANTSMTAALTNDQIFSLTYIYMAVLPLSLIGSVSVIAVSIRRGKCLKSPVRPLFILSLSDFLAGSFLISTAIIELMPEEQYIHAYCFCTYGVMLALMFYAISFLMVIAYALEVHQVVRSLRNPRNTEETIHTGATSRLYVLYGMAWLIPFLLFLAQVIANISSMTDIIPVFVEDFQPLRGNQSGNVYSLFCSSCIILIHNSKDICNQYAEPNATDLGKKITFFVYLLVVMTCCTFLYCRMNLGQRINEGTPLLNVEGDGFAQTRIRGACRTARVFQLVFVLCWAPAFILSVFSFTSVKPSSLYPLFILQALTVSLQGILNSLAYGWFRRNFRQEATQDTSSLDHAFFEESLRISHQ
ncbi:transmembrane protein 116-like isoform X2 [Ambystoma mexicanum]|uniref:transmembrane protein 116-like isoform X1 n=1 Tax=Ambystoma mexicanum TaxID=8296 RepID=UPI0037E8405B